MLNKAVWVFGGVLAAGVLLLVATVLKQDLPLLEAPGLWVRLGVYLGRNEAWTTPDAAFKELRPVYSQDDPGRILEVLREAFKQLGWSGIHIDVPARRAGAVVESHWLNFKDDIRVQLRTAGVHGWRLDIRSAARIGRVDFGANQRHILDLLASLRQSKLDLQSAP